MIYKLYRVIYAHGTYVIWYFLLQGTGVGEIRNPSDPASYGLDPKKATLKLKFRVQNNYAPIAAAKNMNKKFHNIEAEDENGSPTMEPTMHMSPEDLMPTLNHGDNYHQSYANW